jgi:hypothetical protein
MTPPIQLSLAGDGRTIRLTSETVRKAYFQFTRVNPEYDCRQKYCLQTSLYQREDMTLLDVLHRRIQNIDLHAKDIHRIERELNRQLIKHNLSLVEGEGELLSGYALCQNIGKNRAKVRYIVRYGMIFILETMIKSKLISMKNTDIFWQDRNFDFHYDRYCGLLSLLQNRQIELLFRNRLDLAKSWTRPLSEFQPRQIFTISAIYPAPGFAIATKPPNLRTNRNIR